jgi:hypothetical protein
MFIPSLLVRRTPPVPAAAPLPLAAVLSNFLASSFAPTPVLAPTSADSNLAGAAVAVCLEGYLAHTVCVVCT